MASKDKTIVDALHGENIRQDVFEPELEKLLNKQINLELTANTFYRSLFAFFNRDNVALPNVAKFFLEQTNDESVHANDWINYLNQRGGKVELQLIPAPQRDYTLIEAFTMALNREKMVHDNLKEIALLADDKKDYHLSEFASNFLENQYKEIFNLSHIITKLKRMDLTNGTNLYLFDNLEFNNQGLSNSEPIMAKL